MAESWSGIRGEMGPAASHGVLPTFYYDSTGARCEAEAETVKRLISCTGLVIYGAPGGT